MQVGILRYLRDNGEINTRKLKEVFGDDVTRQLDLLEDNEIIVVTKSSKKSGNSYMRKCDFEARK